MAFLAETRRYATQLGLRLQELSLRDQADIDRAFAEMERVRPDVVYLFGNAVTLTHREAIVGRLTRMRIPATSAYLFIVEAGCFFAYMPLFRDFSKEAARFIDRILRGAKPSELPVTRVSRYELVINLKVARALSLTIPKSQLLRADRVIE